MSLISYTCNQCGGSSYEQFSQTQVRCMHCGSISIFDTGFRTKPEFELSMEEGILNLEKKVELLPASLGKRLANYIIDLFFVVFVVLIVSNFFDMYNAIAENKNNDTLNIFVLIVMLIYYAFMEYKFGKTIGKFITKTSVISKDGTELSFGQCLGRVLCRLIPFNQISGLFTNGVFWHDSIPKTLVVEDK